MLSPVVWAGIICAGLSVVLLGTSAALRERGRAAPATDAGKQRETRAGRRKGELPPAAQAKGEPLLDDDLSDIEAILKRRGIT